MGYLVATAPCAGCGRLVNFNPSLVPSINNEPICRGCIEKANPIRVAKGLPPIVIMEGAYDPEEVA